MSLSRGKPFSQSAWRGSAIFAFPLIEEFTTKSGHEAFNEQDRVVWMVEYRHPDPLSDRG
jgi:hypothetical protein